MFYIINMEVNCVEMKGGKVRTNKNLSPLDPNIHHMIPLGLEAPSYNIKVISICNTQYPGLKHGTTALLTFKIIKRRKINHNEHASAPKLPSTFKIRNLEDSQVLLAESLLSRKFPAEA